MSTLKQVNKIRIFDLIFDLWCIAWFILPVSLGPGEIGTNVHPRVLYPFMEPYFLYAHGKNIAGILLFLAYLLPLYGFTKASLTLSFWQKEGKMGKTALWLENPSGLFTIIFRVAATFIMAIMLILPLLYWGDYSAWFDTYPPAAIVSFCLAFILNLCCMYFFFQYFTIKNPAYAEYKAQSFDSRKSGKKGTLSVRAEFIFKIRTKLFAAFVGIIAVILVSMSLLILGRYRKTILELVGDTAHTQVVQATASYRINLGDTIAMFEYLNRQEQLNKTSDFAYEELTIYTSLKPEIYMNELPETFPDFRAEFSTREPSEQYPDITPLSGSNAASWIEMYRSTGSVPAQSDEENGLFLFVDPIVRMDTIRMEKERVRKERLLGFSVIAFKRDIVMRSFFKTRITVYVCTGMFLHLAILLTYLVGNYIVNPLLFLRMNVRKISTILSGMISGTRRVSSSQLVYEDYVKSRDEIKSLSGEINDMVSVIRGIVPYISASTLKQAESGNTATVKKDLTFLFTDIRGFTTLCEGLPAEEVVGILNHYLDLETEIILNNHGDVDKFVGDEMMAFFDGPDKEKNACYAAMQIRTAMMAEREKCLKENRPVISIGIGINTGSVVFGSVGARDRMDFTSIGDTVNLAARLEGANKAYLSKSIITEAVYTKIQSEFVCRELDFITVKGKTEPVRIYEILQETTRASSGVLKIKSHFEKGLAAYRKKKWDKAAEAFQRGITEFDDGPASVFLERVNHFAKNPPPENWDGVFRMTVK